MISISAINAVDNSSVDAVLSVDDADSAGDVSLVETVDSTLDELSSEGDVSVTTSAKSSSDDSTGSSDSVSLAANDTASNSSVSASTVAVNKKATKLTAKSYTYKYARKTLTLKAKRRKSKSNSSRICLSTELSIYTPSFIMAVKTRA